MSETKIETGIEKKISFDVDGLLDGVNMTALRNAVDTLHGKHSVNVDGENSKEYADAVAVIIENAGKLTARAGEIRKNVLTQMSAYREVNKTTNELSKTWRWVGNNYAHKATASEGMEVTNPPKGAKGSDCVRYIAAAAVNVGGADALKTFVEIKGLKKIDAKMNDEAKAKLSDVLKLYEEYGVKTVEKISIEGKPEVIEK
jgi:hypothetical protein